MAHQETKNGKNKKTLKEDPIKDNKKEFTQNIGGKFYGRVQNQENVLHFDRNATGAKKRNH